MATEWRCLALLFMVYNDGMEFPKVDTSKEGIDKRAGLYIPTYLTEEWRRYNVGYPRMDTKE